MRVAKISYLRFSRKVSILQHMLLHNSYINVATADRLVKLEGSYGIPEVQKRETKSFKTLN